MIGATVSVVLAVPVLLAAGWAGADAGGRWATEVHLGGTWNLPLPLLIRQETAAAAGSGPPRDRRPGGRYARAR